jgi:hypothetical protein
MSEEVETNELSQLTEEEMAGAGMKPKDKVQRKSLPGCYGIVKDVRKEVTATSIDTGTQALIVSVQWDNGTFSYFTPDALETV